MATGLVGIPNRYMHSPVEVVHLDDLTNAARLLAEFCAAVGPEHDWTPYWRTAVVSRLVKWMPTSRLTTAFARVTRMLDFSLTAFVSILFLVDPPGTVPAFLALTGRATARPSAGGRHSSRASPRP